MKLFYDFHLHSALSPCGDNDMTPNNIVNMAKLLGLDVIALTDHNSAKNCRAAMHVGENVGLTVIPGMELCTAEEVHVVCLFPDISAAENFSEYVHANIPPVKNKPYVFGEQLILNENDEIVGTEDTLLVTASAIPISKVPSLLKSYGGVCFPAHIDRNSYSIISNLGTINESFGFSFAEIFDMTKESALKDRFPFLNEIKIFGSSDAHYLENMREAANCIKAKSNTVAEILKAL